MIYNEKEYTIINCSDEKKRSRYWTIIVYTDSCNNDWINILRNLGVKACISPLHSYDKYEEVGIDGYKKPHYHIIVVFDYGARLSDIASICDEIGAMTRVEIVRNPEYMWEYLTHKNYPEKHQYKISDIQYINSEIYDYIQKEFRDILNYIDDNKCKSLHSLTWSLRINNNDKLLEYVSKNTFYITSYIKSRNDKMIAHINSLLERCITILDNIDENIEPDKEEIKTLKSTVNQYISEYDDLPF